MSTSEVIPGQLRQAFPIDLGWRNFVFALRTSLAGSSPWRSPIGSASRTRNGHFSPSISWRSRRRARWWRRDFYRAIGTVMGALWALMILSLYAEAGVPFVLSMVIWLGLCIYAAARTRNFVSYGFLLAGYTALLWGFRVHTGPAPFKKPQ